MDVAAPGERTKGLGRWRFAGVALACVLLALAFQLTRGAGNHTWNTLWAEDYGVLLQGAVLHHLWHNVFTPYAGYLQVAPRLLGQPMAWFPLSWAAPYVAVVESLLVVGCAAIVWNRSGVIMRSTVARLVVAGIIPLLPQAGQEVNASLIDAHWFLDIALFWVLLVPPKTLRGQLLAASLAIVTALSDPLAVIALIPAIVVFVRDRRWFPQLIAPTALVVALGIQQWVHSSEVTFRFSQTAKRAIPEILGQRVVLNALVGDRNLGRVYDALGPASIVLAVVLLAVVLIVLARRSTRASMLYAATFLVGAAAFGTLELALRGTAGYLTAHPFLLFPSRYFVVPIVFLWSSLAVLVDGRRRAPSHGAPRMRGALLGSMATTVLGLVVLTEVAVGYSSATVRTNHPTWTANLQYMESACRRPPDQRGLRVEARLGGHTGNHDAPVPIGPGDVSVYPEGLPAPGTSPVFALVLPCSRLGRT